jgi:hypothetical protein
MGSKDRYLLEVVAVAGGDDKYYVPRCISGNMSELQSDVKPAAKCCYPHVQWPAWRQQQQQSASNPMDVVSLLLPWHIHLNSKNSALRKRPAQALL